MVPWGTILVAPKPTRNIDGIAIWMIFEAPGLPNSILQMLKRTEYSITVVLEAEDLTRRWERRINSRPAGRPSGRPAGRPVGHGAIGEKI